METKRSILAWHFLREDCRLGYGDGRLIEAGSTVTIEGDLVLCQRGMHGSIRALDALKYAPGPIVCRVLIEGVDTEMEVEYPLRGKHVIHRAGIVSGDDKLCGESRTVLTMADATDALQEFACWCATAALTAERDAGREPDPSTWAAVEAKRRWLRNEISDEELSAAGSAAWSAAWSAASSAAWSAAWSAARSAAWSAAGSAASSAARSAAWSAARSAAESAARSAAWSAAGSAARSAAWSAAGSAQNAELERLLRLLIGIPKGDEITRPLSLTGAKENE